VVKRVVAGVLWFYTVASLWNGLVLATGVLSGFGLLLGALVAVVVWSNPTRMLWAVARRQESADRPTRVAALDSPG
jgi:hypothetical protein